MASAAAIAKEEGGVPRLSELAPPLEMAPSPHPPRAAAAALGMGLDDRVLQALADLARSQAEVLARDLAAFARHARRKQIQGEDVLLALRRNPALAEALQQRTGPLAKE